MSNVAQRSFAAGEIAPSLYARTDQARYATGLRKCRNFTVQRHGGIANRPGTQFIVEVKDSTKTVRLVKFVFNAEQTYILEFGDQYIRFIRDGAQIVLGASAYEIVSPYLEADLMELQFVQSGDVITIVHPDYAPRELSRTAHTAWTLTVITFGASIGSVTSLSGSGGAAGANTYYAVTAIDAATGEEGLPAFYTRPLFVPTAAAPITLTWDPLLGADRYNVYRSTDGSTYEEIVGTGGTPTVISDTTWSDASETASTTLMNTVVASAGQCRNDVIAGGLNKPYNEVFTAKGTLNASITGANFGVVKGQVRAYYKRDAEARVDAGIIFDQYMSGTGVSSGASAFAGNITVPDNGYATLQLDFVAEVEGITQVGTGNTFSAALLFTTTPNDVIERSVVGTGFVDDGADGDPLSTPPLPRNLFDQAGKYPSSVTYYQQRRLFANSTDEPETVWASRTGAYANFYISNPLQDDDAVTWSLAGRQVNPTKHMLDLQRLVTFTASAEMTVEGDDAGILRPDAINPRNFSYNGSGRLPPLPINDSAVYLQARGNRVRDLRPDGGGYTSTELTLFAAHLFDGYTISDWDFALVPNSIVWAARSDGTLLGLTYIPDQEVWGWHRHDTDGVIERVCTIPEGDEDRLYMVVRRTIGGVAKRYIERLHSRLFADVEDAVFMDSALSYDGAPATVFSGLAHLNGEAVTVVGDGVVVANPNDPDLATLTVAAGAVTLPAARSVVHIGLPYISDMETLDLDTPSGRSLKTRKMLVNRVYLYVEETQGVWAGIAAPSDDAVDPLEGLAEYTYDDSALVTDAIEVNIETSWNSNGRIFVRQVSPQPVTILAAIPEGKLP